MKAEQVKKERKKKSDLRNPKEFKGKRKKAIFCTS
jgi:hypothetical protein